MYYIVLGGKAKRTNKCVGLESYAHHFFFLSVHNSGRRGRSRVAASRRRRRRRRRSRGGLFPAVAARRAEEAEDDRGALRDAGLGLEAHPQTARARVHFEEGGVDDGAGGQGLGGHATVSRRRRRCLFPRNLARARGRDNNARGARRHGGIVIVGAAAAGRRLPRDLARARGRDGDSRGARGHSLGTSRIASRSMKVYMSPLMPASCARSLASVSKCRNAKPRSVKAR